MGPSSAGTGPENGTGFRVLTYNIRAMRDSRKALVRVIAACGPDVVCLQEAPRLLFWRTRRRSLMRATGLVPAVNRRACGLAVLVRPGVGVRAARHVLLTRRRGLHRRAVSMALLEVAGERVAVASTHLDLEESARCDHAREALEHLRRFAGGTPRILAGDINGTPGGEAWRIITAELSDAGAAAPYGEAATFTARRPRRRIDAVFTGPGVRVAASGVPVGEVGRADMEAATDHRPVVADLHHPR
ncbi:endonuclease/exonuclease/phosphatase family protein [Nocardiopsis sp. RSe5-2]|uniref:Endonuclease/exonuclease/phosphatase family protein n=1 Tax=Nocardiopsis endophytica TaxID=3018445 RepID=A0ABT4UC53_9ACTN|nr:endonuclease/exonuclease/phosphatase family protein [Nocardiopsis endophytica]MDA2814493.1 endonuclease/exonuclease/phosphatase family protein [Nocardiopsis endophytica]